MSILYAQTSERSKGSPLGFKKVELDAAGFTNGDEIKKTISKGKIVLTIRNTSQNIKSG